jgi:pilus assembly protein CpaC
MRPLNPAIWIIGLLALLRSAAAQTPATGVTLPVGAGTVIDCPADVVSLSTSSPEIVDLAVVSRREFLMYAKAFGQATVGVWFRSGERAIYEVRVVSDMAPIQRLLRETFPGQDIQVQGVKDSLSLTGQVTSQAQADRAVALLVPLAKAVVSNLRVVPESPEKQVLLRVRFVELNRTAAKTFGLGLVSIGALNTIGRITTGQFAAPQPDKVSATGGTFTISDALNVFAFRPDLNLAAFLQALQTQGLLQVLAEPNLVTSNGKEASFLVGGEIPVPVVQASGTSNAISIQYREFGIRLTFQPDITPLNTIRLHVKPEVSMLDPANGVVLSGFNIPALSTRRMETNIELAEGQSFVIAGLLEDRMVENMSKLPVLSQIPLLGALFRSRQENKTKTELVVVVTPEITDPAEAARLLPEPVMPKEFLKVPAPAPERAR